MSNIDKKVKPEKDKKDVRTPLEKLAGMSKKNKHLEALVKEFNTEVQL